MAQWGSSETIANGMPLCARFVDALPITGAAVSVFGTALPETSVCASDALAARLDEMQYELGEGPRWQAVRTRLPVLLPHVRRGQHPAWPVYAQALSETTVEAMFVFPLLVGALDVGVVELYSSSPDALGRDDQDLARSLADAAAWTLLDRILTMNDQHHQSASSPSPSLVPSPLARREIHQATGMVLVQLGLTPTEALMRLRAHAFSHSVSLREVSRQIVARTLVLTS